MNNLAVLETIRTLEYYRVTSDNQEKNNFIMVLNNKDVYQIQNGKWVLEVGLYDYLFINNDDSLDRNMELLSLEEAVREGLSRKAEIIINIKYYKVTNDKLNKSNYIMIINEEYAYQLQEDGKWLYKKPLYNYLFNNDDSLDRKIEPLNIDDAIIEARNKEKTLGSKY